MPLSLRTMLLASCLLALPACEQMFPPTMHPDYAIRVTPTAHGNSVATPPRCADWKEESVNPFDSQPYPQFGCAAARNLASMIETPTDVVEGRTLGNQRGVMAVGAVRRYDNNQTRGLVMPAAETSAVAATTASSTASPLTGDVTAAGSSSSAGSGAAGPAP